MTLESREGIEFSLFQDERGAVKIQCGIYRTELSKEQCEKLAVSWCVNDFNLDKYNRYYG